MKDTIKAIVKKESQQGLWLSDVSLPSIDDCSVLIKVKKQEYAELIFIFTIGISGHKKQFPSLWSSVMNLVVSLSIKERR